jgi:hypothetical protein
MTIRSTGVVSPRHKEPLARLLLLQSWLLHCSVSTIAFSRLRSLTIAVAEAFTFGLSTLIGVGAMAVCLEASSVSNIADAVGIATLGVSTRSGAKLGLFPQNGKPQHKPKPKYHKPVGQPKGSRTHYGQWPLAVYGPQDLDCSVTYTCRYGLGFDEVTPLLSATIFPLT